MKNKEPKRKKRNFQPDLKELASYTECTGILPAQTVEQMPDADELKDTE